MYFSVPREPQPCSVRKPVSGTGPVRLLGLCISCSCSPHTMHSSLLYLLTGLGTAGSMKKGHLTRLDQRLRASLVLLQTPHGTFESAATEGMRRPTCDLSCWSTRPQRLLGPCSEGFGVGGRLAVGGGARHFGHSPWPALTRTIEFDIFDVTRVDRAAHVEMSSVSAVEGVSGSSKVDGCRPLMDTLYSSRRSEGSPRSISVDLSMRGCSTVVVRIPFELLAFQIHPACPRRNGVHLGRSLHPLAAPKAKSHACCDSAFVSPAPPDISGLATSCR
jgi:hypothetical protein